MSQIQQSRLSRLASFNISSRDILDFLDGYRYFLHTGITPHRLHLNLIRAYCDTNGLVQEVINDLRTLPNAQLINNICLNDQFLQLSSAQFTDVLHSIKDNGYSILPHLIPEQVIDRIISGTTAFSKSCVLYDGSISDVNINNLTQASAAKVITSNVIERDLLTLNDVRLLAKNKVLLSIARSYFRCLPILRHVGLWHTFQQSEFSDFGASEAAQKFHFDLDEFKWLKVFIYLTDVTSTNGPHVYIPATHTVGSKSPQLLAKYYSRISDKEMSEYHQQSTWKPIYGKRGTIIIADTKCWHKGTPVLSGTRSMMCIELAPSLFSKTLTKL